MADMETKRWLSTLDQTPTGDAGVALQDNFLFLENYYGPTTLETTDPTITDDQAAGYWPFSWWFNTANQSLWLCVDNTTGAAVWRQQSGNQNPTVETAQFDTALATPAWVEGLVFYDQEHHTFAAYNDVEGVTQNLGEEIWQRVRNATGTEILNGVPVAEVGALGNKILITPCRADDDELAKCIGFTTHDLANNADGVITNIGVVHDVDTSAWVATDTLYLTNVAGIMATSPPGAPSYSIAVAKVKYSHASLGELTVLNQWVDPTDAPAFKELCVNTTLDVTGVSSLTGGVVVQADDVGLAFGAASDAELTYDGTDVVLVTLAGGFYFAPGDNKGVGVNVAPSTAPLKLKQFVTDVGLLIEDYDSTNTIGFAFNASGNAVLSATNGVSIAASDGQVYIRSSATNAMHFYAGGLYQFHDVDAGDTTRIYFDSSNGNIFSTGSVLVDVIVEATASTGVTVEAVLIKDGLIDGVDITDISWPNIESDNALNCLSYERQSIVISESAGVVSVEIEAIGGGDIRWITSSGIQTLDCTPTATKALTTGTIADPVLNWIYVSFAGGVATLKSSATFPTGEFGWIGAALLQTAAETATSGPLALQRTSEDMQRDSGRGRISYIGERLRQQGAMYDDGVELTITDDTGVVTVATSSGTVYQMHRQTFSQFVDGATLYQVNHPTTRYTQITDLADISDLAGGGTWGNNRHIAVRLYGYVASGDSGVDRLLVSLPDGDYIAEDNAVADSNGYDNDAVPNEVVGGAFAIARIVLKKSPAGVVSYVSETDLRRSVIGAGGTGGGGGAAQEFSDATFRIFDSADSTAEIDFDASDISASTTRTITMPDADVSLADLVNLEAINLITSPGVDETIDWSSNRRQKITLDAATETTLTFTAPSTPDNLILTVVQPASGDGTIVWPAGMEWPDKAEPVLTATNGAKDHITIYYDGTTFGGAAGLNFGTV